MRLSQDPFLTNSTYWLIVLAMSSMLSANYAYRIAFGQQTVPKWLAVFSGLAGTTMVGMLVLDGLNRLQDYFKLDARLRSIASVGLICLAAALSYLYLRFGTLRISASDMLRRPAAWIILACTVGTTTWSWHRFRETVVDATERVTIEIFNNGELYEIPDIVAVTDRGRMIRLYRYESESSPEQISAMSESLKKHIGDTAIARAARDPQANCHGWVFTGGRFLVKGEHVQAILDDNGYVRVTEPETGDVVVYRAPDAYITHTGVVRGVLDDGTIIVESKWGVEGTYLHEPEDQPFSQIFDYYRSPRTGHQLVLTPRRDSDPKNAASSRLDLPRRPFHEQRQMDRPPESTLGSSSISETVFKLGERGSCRAVKR